MRVLESLRRGGSKQPSPPGRERSEQLQKVIPGSPSGVTFIMNLALPGAFFRAFHSGIN